jgi:hypothetical protein
MRNYLPCWLHLAPASDDVLLSGETVRGTAFYRRETGLERQVQGTVAGSAMPHDCSTTVLAVRLDRLELDA